MSLFRVTGKKEKSNGRFFEEIEVGFHNKYEMPDRDFMPLGRLGDFPPTPAPAEQSAGESEEWYCADCAEPAKGGKCSCGAPRPPATGKKRINLSGVFLPPEERSGGADF